MRAWFESVSMMTIHDETGIYFVLLWQKTRSSGRIKNVQVKALEKSAYVI